MSSKRGTLNDTQITLSQTSLTKEDDSANKATELVSYRILHIFQALYMGWDGAWSRNDRAIWRHDYDTPANDFDMPCACVFLSGGYHVMMRFLAMITLDFRIQGIDARRAMVHDYDH